MAIWATKHAAALLDCAKKIMCTHASNGHFVKFWRPSKNKTDTQFFLKLPMLGANGNAKQTHPKLF
jgi:hypothetical protein